MRGCDREEPTSGGRSPGGRRSGLARVLRPLLLLATCLGSAGAIPAGDLPFFYDLYTFRGGDEGTVVVAAFAVRAGDLEPVRRDGRVLYRFDVSLVLADTVLQTVHRSDDSVYVAASGPLPDEHLLFTHVEMRAPPSPNVVQRVVMTDAGTPGVGQLYDAPYPVPAYSGDSLMISDIALGQPGSRAGWTRDDVTLALLPTSQFPSSSFDVYYEIYNLPYGRRYTTEVLVEPTEGDRRGGAGEDRAVGLRFSGESDARFDRSLPELRLIQAALARGRYRLTVIVTDEDTGRTARRSREFEVRGWEPGATMVPALPRTSR